MDRFRELLASLSLQLTQTEWRTMCQFFSISPAISEGFHSAFDFFLYLENAAQISSSNVKVLRQLLERLNKQKLVETLIIPYEMGNQSVNIARSGAFHQVGRLQYEYVDRTKTKTHQ
jgi:hypothetical protein